VDVVIEMGYYDRPDPLDRRRRLVALSRSDETPRHLLIELSSDHTHYEVLESGVEASFGDGWQGVQGILHEATETLTRQQIYDRWPQDYPKPDPTTLWRWLAKGLAQGIIRQSGTGRPNDPYRYWHPDRANMLRPENGTPAQIQEWNDRVVAEMFESMPQLPKIDNAPLGATMIPAPAAPAPAPDDVPPPDSAAPAPPAAEPPPPTVEDVSHLAWPYNLLTPDTVPAIVWRKAWAAKQKKCS
jgi:hypothetical protein